MGSNADQMPVAPRDQAIEILEPVQIVTDASLRATATWFMLGLFGLSVVTTFAIIVFKGMGYLNYPDAFLNWLGGATIGEMATFLGFIMKYLFPQPIENKIQKMVDRRSKGGQ